VSRPFARASERASDGGKWRESRVPCAQFLTCAFSKRNESSGGGSGVLSQLPKTDWANYAGANTRLIIYINNN
jgi:hypothetical protein